MQRFTPWRLGAKLIGENVSAIRGDISALADLDRLFAAVKSTKGRVDILLANAGLGERAVIGDLTEEHFDRVFGVNVKGTFFTVQKALPLLTEGASVIMTGSVAGVKGLPSLGPYSASKAAIRSFARTWPWN